MLHINGKYTHSLHFKFNEKHNNNNNNGGRKKNVEKKNEMRRTKSKQTKKFLVIFFPPFTLMASISCDMQEILLIYFFCSSYSF